MVPFLASLGNSSFNLQTPTTAPGIPIETCSREHVVMAQYGMHVPRSHFHAAAINGIL
jgi:hypothetical protein